MKQSRYEFVTISLLRGKYSNRLSLDINGRHVAGPQDGDYHVEETFQARRKNVLEALKEEGNDTG